MTKDACFPDIQAERFPEVTFNMDSQEQNFKDSGADIAAD